MRKKYLFFALALDIVGCSTQNDSGSETKTIFGTSQIKLVSLAERNANNSLAAVGNLMNYFESPKTVYPHCTAIQISRKHVLSASHCVIPKLVFDKMQIAKDSDLEKVTFQVFGDLLRLVFEGEKIPLSEAAKDLSPYSKILYSDRELDYIIFEMQTGEGGDAFIDLQKVAKPCASPQLNLYGHPNGAPLSQADQCKIIATTEDGKFLSHDCDALNGTSGGLVVSEDTQAPLAMHLAGPMENSGALYEERKHFESPEEMASFIGCGSLGEEASEAYQKCLKTNAHNRAVFLSVIADDLKTNAASVWQTIVTETAP